MPETMTTRPGAKHKPAQKVIAETAYTVQEVAQHLRVEQTVIYRAVADGTLRATRVGRLIRISQTALDDFLRGVSA